MQGERWKKGENIFWCQCYGKHSVRTFHIHYLIAKGLFPLAQQVVFNKKPTEAKRELQLGLLEIPKDIRGCLRGLIKMGLTLLSSLTHHLLDKQVSRWYTDSEPYCTTSSLFPTYSEPMTIYLEHFWSWAVREVETERRLPPSNVCFKRRHSCDRRNNFFKKGDEMGDIVVNGLLKQNVITNSKWLASIPDCRWEH